MLHELKDVFGKLDKFTDECDKMYELKAEFH